MNAKRTIVLLLLAAAAGLFGARPAPAKNVDLATVPPRDGVQLTIYNSEDLTLVRETRSLTLKKGLNRIQYSWANTLIDPTSVEIRALEKEDQIEIRDTTFPGDKPQHLIWNIESKFEGQARFQVTYFTSGLSWSADYVLISNPAETQMSFDGYVQVYNRSGEDYENAQVRLVVGVVNLVEKIQELARRGIQVPQPSEAAYNDLKKRVMMESVRKADEERGKGARPAEIVKEGLSEYFIYTIEGTQTVPNNWSKRLVSFVARQVKFDILYRMRAHQYGPRPVRFFLLKNDAEHKLGTTPLPDGVVRTFRDNGRDGLSFLGQQSIAYVPIKDDIELNVGTDDEVVYERKRISVARSNFIFDGANPPYVIGWDETQAWTEEVRNYRAKAIRIEVRQVIPGDIELDAEAAKLHDFHTVQFTFDAQPRQKFTWHYKYVQHCGRNAKQDRIRLP